MVIHLAIHAIENKGLLSSVFERETMELPWTRQMVYQLSHHGGYTCYRKQGAYCPVCLKEKQWSFLGRGKWFIN